MHHVTRSYMRVELAIYSNYTLYHCLGSSSKSTLQIRIEALV